MKKNALKGSILGGIQHTAIRQLQSGRASSEEVLQTLRYTLDQLKMSIDAMHLLPGDITALLANLRYRLEPRFAASDIELQWVVGELAPFPHLNANAMRNCNSSCLRPCQMSYNIHRPRH